MTQEQAVDILWGKQIRTTAEVHAELQNIAKKRVLEEEIDNAACREGAAIGNVRVRKSRITKYRS